MSLPVEELIKEVNTEEEEYNYTTSKFKDNDYLVKKKTRMNIKKIQVLASEMNRYYGFNHYWERDKIINTGTS